MKTIVVLGMHRSATSLTARTLNAEVHMGQHLLKGQPDNPKGHYENVHIIKMNDKILGHSKGSWYNPPPLEKILELRGKFDNEMIDIIDKEMNIAKEKGMESWGFKDPRTALTIDLWMPFLKNPQFIVCYRNPIDVSKSLNRIYPKLINIEKGLNLAKIYNCRINDFITKWLEYENSSNN
jgi:hypothetical protein